MDTTRLGDNSELGRTVVDACTLPSAERQLRQAEFTALFDGSVRAIGRSGEAHARLLLSGDATLAERARRLAEAESSCCSFFTFHVSELASGDVAFDVEVPAAYAGVLAGLVAHAERSL